MSNKPLEFKHISNGVSQFKKYAKGRMDGTIRSLRVSQEKVNKALLDGIEWNKIFTIAGLSGSGKSLILEQWKRDFVDYNPHEKFEILSFEFEMLIEDQIARNVSGQLNMTTKDIYSGTHPLLTEEYNKVVAASEKITKYPIWYVDDSGTVDQIKDTIIKFTQDRDLKKRECGLVVTIDHTLLTKGKQGEDERLKIVALYSMAIELKKAFAAEGMRIILLFLSQLNRDIESNDRVINSKLHYPTKNDLFASSASYYSSDYVLISHKPAGIRGIEWYGPPLGKDWPSGLPIRNPQDNEQCMIYWHLIKNRGDIEAILLMVENFKYSKIEEFNNKENKNNG